MVKVSSKDIELISGFMSKLPASSLVNDYTKYPVKKLLKGKIGIYVLYENDKIYYVGKGIIYNELRNYYLHGKHKNNWDSFSFAELKQSRYKEELEDLLISIIHPPGNVKEEKKVKRDRKVEDQIKKIIELVKPDIPQFHEQQYSITKRIKGKHFTHKKAENLILQILSQNKKPLTRKNIVNRVYNRIRGQLKPVDKKHLKNGRPRWENIVRWEVTGMNMRKLITSTRHNDWVLSKKGKKRAKQG
jgi:hypothetical protein